MEEDGDTENCRRTRRQTAFYASKPLETSKKKVKRLSMKIGDVPQDLKPILRKKSSLTTSAKKIVKKYSKERKSKKSLTYSNRCQIQIVSPLPGWNEDVLRMPSDSEQSFPSAGNDLFLKVKITPESLERLAIVCNESAPDHTKVQFNAQLPFGTPTGGNKMQKKKDLVTLEKPVNDDPVVNEAENDILKSLSSLHDPNRRKSITKVKNESLSSWILSTNNELDSTLEKENRAVVITVAAQGRRSKRKSLSNSQNKGDEQKSDTVLRACRRRSMRCSAKPSTDIDCCNTMRTPKERNIFKRNNKQEEEPSITKETKRQKSIPVPRLNKRRSNIAGFMNEKKAGKLPESNRKVDSSPEILIISETSQKSQRSKRKCSGESNTSKRVPLDIIEKPIREKRHISQYRDWTPVPTDHKVYSVYIKEEEDLPEIAWVPKNHQKRLNFDDEFPSEEIPKIPAYISLKKIMDAEKPDLLSTLDVREQEWINSFHNHDPNILWTDVFSPKTVSQWIGDSSVSTDAAVFVKRWKKRLIKEAESNEKISKKNSQRTKSGDVSDDGSDYEEEENIIRTNPLILLGPSGSGKTALISAIAVELNMNVVEVHPGDKRSAAALKQKLDGTLKNHALCHQNSSITAFMGGSQKAIPDKNNLIVLEHVDVHFKEDNDFWPTLKSLVEESRVPIIWTCESLPSVQLQREPCLNSYKLLRVERCAPTILAKYIRCCLLITRNLDASPHDLENYVKSFNCDLRSILADLQVQTAETETLRLNLPEITELGILPSSCNKETYRNKQEYMDDKKLQYSSLYSSLELSSRPIIPPSVLIETAEALKNRLPQTLLVLDILPYLVEMDKVEKKKFDQSRSSQRRKRYLHYFHVVRNDEDQVDSNDTLIPLVRQFSLTDTSS